MRSWKSIVLTALLICVCGVATAPEAQARDWPNPFRWMKKKMKGEKPPPPPPSALPPRPSPNPPPTPAPPPRNEPNSPSGEPRPAPNPAPAANEPGPGRSDSGPPRGGATGGGDPAPATHVHQYKTVREEVVEPARYERVPAGRDQYGAPRFENRLVAPERRVLKDVQKCACGAKR